MSTPSRALPGRAAGTVGAGLLSCVLAACGTAANSEGANGDPRTTAMTESTLPAAERNEGGPLRTDLAPLTRRFPALGDPEAAHWQSGTLGDDEAPGPTSYWIDAVVEVRPETAAELRQRPGVQERPAPAVAAALTGQLPEGQWLGGDGLDRAFATGGFGGQAYVHSDTDTVVLVVQGGN